jgi:AcrR family transcriptional regulator
MLTSRSERARAEVLDTAAQVVAELGVDRLTIDEVAARSGVAKTTIYRHWPTKKALIVDAVRLSCQAVTATPNSGDLRQDLIACFDGLVHASLTGRPGKILPSLVDAAGRDPEMDHVLREYLRERCTPTRTVLQLAQLRDELPGDLDVDLAVTLLVGPILYRKVLQREPVTADFVASVVDALLRGLGVDTGPAPPGGALLQPSNVRA